MAAGRNKIALCTSNSLNAPISPIFSNTPISLRILIVFAAKSLIFAACNKIPSLGGG